MKITIISLSVTHSLSFARKDKKISFVFSRQLQFLLHYSPPPLFRSILFLSRNSQLSRRARVPKNVRIRLFGNQTETSRNKGKSIQDRRGANTEAISICSLLPLLPPKTQHRLQRITNFVCLFVPALLVETSRAPLAPEYQLPPDIRERARTKSIPSEHKVRTGGHSLGSRPSSETCELSRVAGPLLSLTVRTEGKRKREERGNTLRRKTIEEGNPRKFTVDFRFTGSKARRCRAWLNRPDVDGRGKRGRA